MITARGFWLLLWAFVLAFAGLVGLAWWSPLVATLPLTLLLWFGFEWGLFNVRRLAAVRRLRIDRQLFQGGREVPTVWAGVNVTVRLTVTLTRGLRLPFTGLADRLPAGFGILDGTRRTLTELRPGEPVVIEYTVKADQPGVIKFEGVEVRLADLCGFFYHRSFVRTPVEYLVLPPLADDEGGQRATKRFNSLPPPGVHRLRRAGSGSELLDLREYRAGDPPKMVAWKASARRDMLITKEFESDVPVRCTLFVDASNGVRVGEPGATPLARACGIGAAVAQAAAANRDLVGLTVFDETSSERYAPARTRIHTMRMLRTFAETAGRLPDDAHTDPDTLRRQAYSVAQEIYPDLLDKRVNARPLGLFWIPLLNSRARWLLLIPAVAIVLAAIFRLEALNLVADIARSIVRPRGPAQLIPFVAVGIVLLLSPLYLTLLYWFIFGIRGIFPPRSTALSRRKQLAALFASLDADSPAVIERYIHDDPLFAARCNRFLAEHRSLPPPQMYDKDGTYRFACIGKIATLADSLRRGIGYARDNELFVVLADLAELSADIEPLLKAVRAASGRHHKVLFLLPWPEELPPPAEAVEPKRRDRERISLGFLLEAALRDEYYRRYEAVRLALVRAGATVFRVDAQDPVRLILDRMDRIRGVRVRR